MITPGISRLLTDTAGLNPVSLGARVVERVLQHRMAATGCARPEDYQALASTSPAELQTLIEELVVPETWFFRDPAAFAALADWARTRWLPGAGDRVLRIVSIPCSTGEEPYSIAMALLDAGLPAARLAVTGMDISGQALRRAEAAVYGAGSFRGRDLGFRARHFERDAGGWRLVGPPRERVQFQQRNLMELDAPAASLDVIFCRNLLIYLEESAQGRAVDLLARLLRPDGLLFVGPAEAYLARREQLRPLGRPMAFGFVRVEPAAPAPRPARRKPPPSTRPAPARPAPASGLAPGRARRAAAAPPVPEVLDRAEALANAGRLQEATALCQEALARDDSLPRAHYLCGLVRDALGDPAAATVAFRKAVYLDPQHEAALLHLALIARREGRQGDARRLEERARRAHRAGGGHG